MEIRRNHCVYLILSNRPYIGQTNNFRATWNRHNSLKNNYPIACSLRKYGKTKAEIKIIHSNLTQSQANIWEIIEIANYNSFIGGYNLTFGGYGKSGYKVSTKTKKLIGIKSKNRFHSLETRIKIGKAGLGNQRALGSHPNRKGQHKGNQFAKDKHWSLSKETKLKHKRNISAIVGTAKRKNLTLQQYLINKIKQAKMFPNNKQMQRSLKTYQRVLVHISQ